MSVDLPNVLENLSDLSGLPNVATMEIGHIDGTKPPFVLVDGSYYLFRTYHALPTMTTTQGLHTNAIRGTLNALMKLMRRYQPTHMAVAFDTREPTFRHVLAPSYKAHRVAMDAALAEQIPYLHRLIAALGIPLVTRAGFEADDIIGTLTYQACLEGHKVVISTGDKDMAQLVNGAVILEDGFSGKITDVAGVEAKFGIQPSQMVDYLTLVGDSSDGIAGVKGIGKVTAQKLLNEYGNLHNILTNVAKIKGKAGKNLLEHAADIPLNRKLTTIVTNLDLNKTWDDLKVQDPAHHNAKQRLAELTELYQTLEFKNELNALMHPNNPIRLHANLENDPSFTQQDDPNCDFQDRPIDPIDLLHNSQQNPRYHTILDKKDFDDLIATLQTLPYFAIDTETTSKSWQTAELVGIAIGVMKDADASLPTAYYIPLAHSAPDLDANAEQLQRQLDRQSVLDKLKPILENIKIGKIGQNLKYDAHILRYYGINLNICPQNWTMDTMLASYVLNASATRHNLDDLARHYLKTQTIHFEDVAGKGAKQISFDKVAIDKASEYACEDVDISLQLFDLFKKMLVEEANDQALLTELEIPVAQILCQMEADGILVDKDFLTELSIRFDKEMVDLQDLAHQQAGEVFNLSSPKQLGEILFEKLGLKGGKKTKTGQYSTSEEVLSKLDHPLAESVLAYRGLSKLKSTYTDALAKVADEHNRVHTHYHQALTSTGRLSSAEPNLQNIPIRTATGRLIREAFIAPEDRVLLAADYSQIELRLMAHFSGDPDLIAAFQQGLDIHTATAAEVLGKPLEGVTATERRNAKAINFGLLYGMSAFGLSKQLQMSREQAGEYINLYFDRYPKVKQYMVQTRQYAYEHGYVKTILGRKLFTPDIHHDKPMIKQAAERAAINAPLQGSAAEIIKLAMVAVEAILPKDQAKMLLQVHDELVFEVDKLHAETLGEQIRQTMQDVFIKTARDKGWQVDFAVPLLVEIGVGKNWEVAH